MPIAELFMYAALTILGSPEPVEYDPIHIAPSGNLVTTQEVCDKDAPVFSNETLVDLKVWGATQTMQLENGNKMNRVICK